MKRNPMSLKAIINNIALEEPIKLNIITIKYL